MNFFSEYSFKPKNMPKNFYFQKKNLEYDFENCADVWRLEPPRGGHKYFFFQFLKTPHKLVQKYWGAPGATPIVPTNQACGQTDTKTPIAGYHALADSCWL